MLGHSWNAFRRISVYAQQSPVEQSGMTQRPSVLAERVAALRSVFESERTRPYAWRVEQLTGLARMLETEEAALLEALRVDMGKPRLEAWSSEINEVAASVRYLRKSLKKWMRPERVATPVALQPGKSWVQREPLGVVLIIAPWNYPLLLSLNPLAGALAAGNTALLKPSEVAPATSALLARLLPQYLDREAVAVVEGGVQETTELLAQRWDHVFYTGSGTVGRIVMQAAAEHLTPVTLELGGKSPCIVDAEVDLEVAVKRIAWAKFFNCGQTCVAPDYVLVHEGIHDTFVERLKATVRSFWGERPIESQDYGRIINARHHRRLMQLLAGSARIALGGEANESERYLAPTVLTHVDPDEAVMQEEIFGPILPVLKVSSIEQAISFVNARPKPLALYLFSSDAHHQERVLARTSSGGAVINHAVVHLAVQGLPFGGVGPSGMGAYHGKYSFETFTHRKAVLKKSTALDPTLVYPPYTSSKEAWLKRLL